jgi:predicted MFS family arabinose efflux permease
MEDARPATGGRARALTLASLSLLYVAQGIPYGLAVEYVPVVLRQADFSLSAINAIGWLQIPWQLKVLWARLGDHPAVRPRAPVVLLGLQGALAAVLVAMGIWPLGGAMTLWLVLLFVSAALASTQDVFVDALAVRTLGEDDRGAGNVAQVAGYRIGMLAGGAGLLVLAPRLGERNTLFTSAAFVMLASVGAFLAREAPASAAPGEEAPPAGPAEARRSVLVSLLRHAASAEAWPVMAIALTFKLGLHVASPLLKPMAVDAQWSREEIGWAVVTVGTTSALIGAAVGGLLHRILGEARALAATAVLQAAVCVPLVVALEMGAPRGPTTIAIAVEHFASGAGTTVLFAALMSATRRSDAGLHYTILTSMNALCIGLGGTIGGAVGDLAGKRAAFVLAGVMGLAPLAFVSRWRGAVVASAREAREGGG